jgi:hypothetical protein
MSHYDEHPTELGAHRPAPDEQRIRQAASSAAHATPVLDERDRTALQRSLLIYGTAGQAARVRLEGHAS